MHLVQRQFPGLLLLIRLNADRLFSLGTVVVGLLAGAYLGTALVGQ